MTRARAGGGRGHWNGCGRCPGRACRHGRAGIDAASWGLTRRPRLGRTEPVPAGAGRT